KMYNPEETIGVIAAQSLSEPATQMTMRTYHFAGTAGIQVTLGLPRIIEIFDARKELETPTMTIKLLPEFQTMEKAKKVAENIKEVKLRDLVVSDILDLTNLEVICTLDSKMLKVLDLDMKEIEKDVKLKKVKVETSGHELKLTSTSMDVKNLHKLKYKLLELHIKGIKDVTQAIVSKEMNEWVVTTLGSNLKKVLKIPGVDANRTTCNNIFEVLEVLGVEAARNAIIHQAKYTLDEQGLGVDVRYIMLLSDLMTFTGDIQAIGRYGIAGQKSSVLARAAFEETKKHLISATIRNDSDDLSGIVENIMVNQVIPAGTGAFGLIGQIPEVPAHLKVPAEASDGDAQEGPAKKKKAAKGPAKKHETARKKPAVKAAAKKKAVKKAAAKKPVKAKEKAVKKKAKAPAAKKKAAVKKAPAPKKKTGKPAKKAGKK
ncbi:MAG: hypothetical protein V1813_03180, partial [Candidatus Aenigmatarchaeota archaeon]